MYGPLASSSLPHPPKVTQKIQKRGHSTTSAGHSRPRCLFVSSQWPETKATAAGVRTRHLVDMFRHFGFDVSFSSMAKSSPPISPANRLPHSHHHSNIPPLPAENRKRAAEEDLQAAGVPTFTCSPNDAEFSRLLTSLKPSVVVFDRFFIEEIFGWEVQQVLPGCLRILDTQDLHFLRAERQQAALGGTSPPRWVTQIDVRADRASRELASIQRCDCTLIISPAEMALLEHDLSFPSSKLFYLPLCLRVSEMPKFDPAVVGFSSRRGLCTIGNFQHDPNVDALAWLKEEIWPLVRARHPAAEFHIYGSHSKPRHKETFHNPALGWHFAGYVDDHLAALARHQLLLAPLRFGAGQKGKIVDAWFSNTPVVTTPIGAEGMMMMMGEGETAGWGGAVATDAESFAGAVTTLLEDESRWNQAVLAGRGLLLERFDLDTHRGRLATQVAHLLETLETRRRADWMAATLSRSQYKATEYLSKYIKASNGGGGRGGGGGGGHGGSGSGGGGGGGGGGG